ncbi:hypothetical protein JCM3774_006758 [Rhodotorula dairenensis]
MGVRDLTTVAKRYAPECITTHASIRDFRGKTLAIDANLLTTKFHFANAYALEPKDGVNPLTLALDEYQGHRHARAWYYFLNRLKAYDIKPIVVFDGSTRLDAKARENERRRVAREVQRLRGEAESIRGDRLRTIRAVLADVAEQDRDDFVSAFRDAARVILDERGRDGDKPGEQAPTRMSRAQEEEKAASLENDRRRVRELIEAFEQLVKAERDEVSASEQQPPLPSSPEQALSRAPPTPDGPSAAPFPVAATQPAPKLDSPEAKSTEVETVAPSPQEEIAEQTLPTEAFGIDGPSATAWTCLESDLAASDLAPTTDAEPPTPASAAPTVLYGELAVPAATDGYPSTPVSASAQDSALSESPTNEPTAQTNTPPLPAASPVGTLATLFAAHLADATNPVYSRNQVDVFRKESQFFSSLVFSTPAAISIDRLSFAQDVLSATEVKASVDDRKITSATQQEPDPGREQGEVVAAAAEKPEDPPTLASYEDDLHPIIDRSSELQQSHDQRARGVSPAAFREVRSLIEALGVPWLQPTPDHPHEAEGVCAALQQHGLADFVISEDTDVVVYGAPVLRNITLADQPKVPMNVLDPAKLRAALGLSQAEFVDFAILLGTDFTERIKGLGPVNALKAVRKYGNIENVLHAESGRFRLSPTFVVAYLATAQAARDIFLNLPPLPEAELPPSGPGDAVVNDGTDAGATARPDRYFGTLRASETSPFLPLLLGKYGISRGAAYDGDDFPDDVFAYNDDLGSLVAPDGAEAGLDWGEDDPGLDFGLVPGAGTVEEVGDVELAEDVSAISATSKIASRASTPRQMLASLDTAFERLHL